MTAGVVAIVSGGWEVADGEMAKMRGEERVVVIVIAEGMVVESGVGAEIVGEQAGTYAEIGGRVVICVEIGGRLDDGAPEVVVGECVVEWGVGVGSEVAGCEVPSEQRVLEFGVVEEGACAFVEIGRDTAGNPGDIVVAERSVVESHQSFWSETFNNIRK